MTATSGRFGGGASLRFGRLAVAGLAAVAVTAGAIASSARAATPETLRLQRLAERAISQGAPGSVRLAPGPIGPSLQLPPIPKEWTQLGRVERTFSPFRPAGAPASPTFIQAFFDVPLAAASTVERWHQSFLGLGWTEAPPTGPPTGLAASGPRLRTFCRKNSQQTVVATSFDTSISVIVNATGEPCASAAPDFPKEVSALLQAMRAPELAAPPSAIVVFRTRSTGSPVSDSAEVTIETPQSVGELHSFAGKQMTANGWTATETATAASLVTSRWRKRVDQVEITAFLLVSTTPGPNRRTISISTWNKQFAVGITFGGVVPSGLSGPNTTRP